MADFRKLLFVLIAGALLFTTVASAQPYRCNATAVPTLVRSEGVAEVVGDVLLLCDGTVPVGGILANIRMLITNVVTSNVAVSGTNILESSLILDEGLTASGLSFRGYASTSYISGASYISQNIFIGRQISNNEIEWQGVWIAGPGATNPYKTIRLTNVRARVSDLGDYGTVYAYINITGSTTVPVDNNQLVVADTRPAMEFSTTARTWKNCESPSPQPSITIKELFASAFRPIGDAENNFIPGGAYKVESNWNPGNYLDTGYFPSNVGQADQGTRFLLRFSGWSTTSVSVAGALSGNGLEVRVLPSSTGWNSQGAGGSMAAAYTSSTGITSAGLALLEVYSASDLSISVQDTFTIPVTVSYGIPGPLTTAMVNVNLAPLATASQLTTNYSAPEPRFIDKGLANQTIFTIGPCRTILLWPYITNQVGFDTGIAVSNTSKDPLGTTNQAGACTLYYYGNLGGVAMTTNTQTTPSIPAGGHLVYLLSGGGGVYSQAGAFTACATGNCVAPLFQGYLFAICDFQYAHGYGFISDFGASKLAQGYLALIIPDRTPSGRMPVDSSYLAGPNQGENTGN